MSSSFVSSAVTCGLAGLLLVATGATAAPLTLAQAERLARTQDVTTPGIEARARSLERQSIADGELPDPRLKLGAMNLPTDSFDRRQEAMTQMQVGLVQRFPPGRSLRLRRLRTQRLAAAERARAEAQRLKRQRDVRQRYLDLWYWLRAGVIVDKSRALFEQLVEVTRSHYASGRRNQQDVLRASVELALLDDRRIRIRTDEARARAALAELIGPAAETATLPRALPDWPDPPPLDAMRAGLDRHPELVALGRRVEAAQRAVDVARQRYRPGWSLDVTYGNRVGTNPDGSDRADFLSAMVLVDLPLFPARRQDALVAARQASLTAASLQRKDRLLQLTQALEADYASYRQLSQRVTEYRERVLPEARGNAAAALQAYQSNVSDFTGLMRARLTELDSRLTALRLVRDRAKARARLYYLQGEDR